MGKCLYRMKCDFLGLKHKTALFHLGRSQMHSFTVLRKEFRRSFNQGIQFSAVHRYCLGIFYVLLIVKGTRDTKMNKI